MRQKREGALPEASSEVLSVEELRTALEQLSATENLRLTKAARYFVLGTTMEPAELLNEAVSRALDGTRSCRLGLRIVPFLIGAMKSIAWAHRDAHNEAPRLVSLSATGTETTALQVPAKGRNAEEWLVAREDYESQRAALEILFADDEPAFLVVTGDIDGMSAEEIRVELDLDLKAYASVRRRIRRKINQAFPRGWRS